MTYEFLKKNGKFIAEVDFNNNGVYAGTRYFYLYENTLYCRHEPTNAFQYNGKAETYPVVDDVKEALKKYNEDYFIFEIGLDEESYIKLKEIYEEVKSSKDIEKVLAVYNSNNESGIVMVSPSGNQKVTVSPKYFRWENKENNHILEIEDGDIETIRYYVSNTEWEVK